MNRLENNMPNDFNQEPNTTNLSFDSLEGNDLTDNLIDQPADRAEGLEANPGGSADSSKPIGPFENKKPTIPDDPVKTKLAQSEGEAYLAKVTGPLLAEGPEIGKPVQMEPTKLNPNKPVVLETNEQLSGEHIPEALIERASLAGLDIGRMPEAGSEDMDGFVVNMARNPNTPAQRQAREQRLQSIFTDAQMQQIELLHKGLFDAILSGQNVGDLLTDVELEAYSNIFGPDKINSLKRINKPQRQVIGGNGNSGKPPKTSGINFEKLARQQMGDVLFDSLSPVRQQVEIRRLQEELEDDDESAGSSFEAREAERLGLREPDKNAEQNEFGVIAYHSNFSGWRTERYPLNIAKLNAWVRERLMGEESLIGENPTPDVQERKRQLEALVAKLSGKYPKNPNIERINHEIEATENLHAIYRNFRDQREGAGIYSQVIKLKNRDQDVLYDIPGVWEVVKALDLHADRLFGARDEASLKNFYDNVTIKAAEDKIRQIPGLGNLEPGELRTYAESAHIKGLRLWEIKRAAARDYLIDDNTGQAIPEDELNDNQLEYVDGEAVWKNGRSVKWMGKLRFNGHTAMRRILQVKEGAAERVTIWKLKSIDVLDGMRGEISTDFYTDYATQLDTKFKAYIRDNNTQNLSVAEIGAMARAATVVVVGPDGNRIGTNEPVRNAAGEIVRNAEGEVVTEFKESKNRIVDIQKLKMTQYDWNQESIMAFYDALGNSMDQTKKEALRQSLFKFGNLSNNENVMDNWATTNITQADPRREALYSNTSGTLANSPSEKTVMAAIEKSAWTPTQVEALAVSLSSFMHRRFKEIKGGSNWNFEDIKGFMNRVAGNNDADKYPPINRKKVNELALRGYLGSSGEEDSLEKWRDASTWEQMVLIINAHPKPKTFIEFLWIILSRFSFDVSRRAISAAAKDIK